MFCEGGLVLARPAASPVDVVDNFRLEVLWQNGNFCDRLKVDGWSLPVGRTRMFLRVLIHLDPAGSSAALLVIHVVC